LIYGFDKKIIRAFTASKEIISEFDKYSIYFVIFFFFNFLTRVSYGFQRSISKQKGLILPSLISLYLIALPIEIILCFPLKWGITGLFSGFAFGLFILNAWINHKTFRVYNWNKISEEIHERLTLEKIKKEDKDNLI